MNLGRLCLLIMVAAIPVTGMAQQSTDTLPAGKITSKSDSLAAVPSKPAANAAQPAPATPGNYWSDPIGDEEEMDAEGGYDYDYQEWLLMWPEQDEGRDFDPLDPREDAQPADTRE